MRDYAGHNFIRVDWPAMHYQEIIARVKNSEGSKQFERICISRISHPDSHDDIFVLLERWARKARQISASILIQSDDARLWSLARMCDLGVYIIAVRWTVRRRR